MFPNLKVLRFRQWRTHLNLFDETNKWNQHDKKLLDLLKGLNARTESEPKGQEGMVEFRFEKGGEEVMKRLKHLSAVLFTYFW